MEIMLGKANKRSWAMIWLFCSFPSSMPSFRGFAGKKYYDKLNFPGEFVQGIYYYFPSVKFIFFHIFSPV